jgi:predicted transcriptional regulator
VPNTPTRGLSTRLQLLLEIHNHRHGKLRTLADRLGVTVQNVSLALKRLTNEGLAENRGGEWRPTQRGTDALHGSIRDLQRFVDDATRNLRLIEDTIAQADAKIRSGERVGLFMRDGRLCAAPRVYASSQGRARESAARGEAIRVGDLRGIVALKPGTLTFIAHPAKLTAAQLRRAQSLLRNGGAQDHRVAAHELASALLVERLGGDPDFEFAPLVATLEAIQRGVPVQYWVPVSALPECMAQLGSNADAQRLTVRSVEL